LAQLGIRTFPDKAEGALLKSFLQEMAKHRIWSRSAKAESVPA